MRYGVYVHKYFGYLRSVEHHKLFGTIEVYALQDDGYSYLGTLFREIGERIQDAEECWEWIGEL